MEPTTAATARTRASDAVRRAGNWGWLLAASVWGYTQVQVATQESEGLWMAGLIIVSFCAPLVSGFMAAGWVVVGAAVGVRHAETRARVVTWLTQTAAVTVLLGWVMSLNWSFTASYLVAAGAGLGIQALLMAAGGRRSRT